MSVISNEQPDITPQNHYLVPDQLAGDEKDLAFEIAAAGIDEAEDLFVSAKEELWNINRWENACPGIPFQFRLADSHGHLVGRRARKGDHIRIGRPGSDSPSGAIHDWVVVEAIEYDDYPDENRESFAVHLRPSSAPAAAAGGYCEATSTVVVARDHQLLKSTYHGRNEMPTGNNPEADRDASAAWLGLSEAEWNCLLRGFLHMR